MSQVTAEIDFLPGERWGRFRDTEYLVSSRARVYSLLSGRYLKPWLEENNRGERYFRFKVCSGGRRIKPYLHRAVAELHVPGFEAGVHVHHKLQPPDVLEHNFADVLECKTPTEHWEHHHGDGAASESEVLPYVPEAAPF